MKPHLEFRILRYEHFCNNKIYLGIRLVPKKHPLSFAIRILIPMYYEMENMIDKMLDKLLNYLLRRKNLVTFYRDPENGLIYIDGVAYRRDYFEEIARLRMTDRWMKIVTTDVQKGITLQDANLESIPNDELIDSVTKANLKYVNWLLDRFREFEQEIKTAENSGEYISILRAAIKRLNEIRND